MAETSGTDAAPKKVVMVTGGTGLVGCGIKEFVESDAEVRVQKFGENPRCGVWFILRLRALRTTRAAV